MLDPVELAERIVFDRELIQRALTSGWFAPRRTEPTLTGIDVYMFAGHPERTQFYDLSDEASDLVILAFPDFGCNYAALVSWFLPYVFVAMHKVLDGIVAWILEANGPVPWKFKQKIEI